MNMNYISKYLCHFVGRSCTNDNERFELLVTIIKEHQLKANLKTPTQPELHTSNHYTGNRLGEIFERCDCVCFCDIPDEMLQIHTSKYSQFGIGFKKTFLSENGTRPVMYVPLSTQIKEVIDSNIPKNSPIEYYLYLNKIAINLIPLLMMANGYNPFHKQIVHHATNDNDIKPLLNLLDTEMYSDFLQGSEYKLLFNTMSALLTQCAYVKIFDESLKEDDLNNYYMEREWRSLKSVNFTMADIQKIYLPSKIYKDKFMKIFPNYAGEFWFFASK